VAGCYLLTGASSFLLQEARDSIWQVANKQGFSNRQIWEVTKRLDWNQVRLQNSYFDLFHRSFIELRFARPSETEGNQLQQLVKEFSAPLSLGPIIVISCEKPLTNMQRSRWFQQIASMSTLIACDPPSSHHFPQWIKHKLRCIGLHLAQEAMSELIQCVEGNLLAAVQIIQKLVLIYGAHKEPLSVEQLRVALEDQAIFELFHLTDAVLKGQTDRCMRIMKHLQAANTPPALVLGYLLKVRPST
jgi:DNA polymerase-3 subunit delta